MPSSMLTFTYRVKDATSGKHLERMGWAVNSLWNYLNEVSLLAWRREKRFFSAFDLINLTAGAGHALGLHTDTLSEVCQEYARRKKTARKIKLHWRSRKRSLPWVPFKGRCVRLGTGTVTYKGRCLRYWDSRPLQGTLKTGSFTRDACGYWSVNLQCEVEDAGVPTGATDIGIDLGLKNQAACSDGRTYSRENLTRTHEDALAMAQRAHKKKRVRKMHAKIAKARKDWAHKTTIDIVSRARVIVVGDVSSVKLAKTRMAKSGIGLRRDNLVSVMYSEELNSTTSSVTLQRTDRHGILDQKPTDFQVPL